MYLKGKKGELIKVVLKGLFWGGAIVIASASPYFIPRVLPKLIKYARYRKKIKGNEKLRFYNAFYYLNKKGLIKMRYCGKQLYISLTPEGRKEVGKYPIDDLKITKPVHWDKKWRILIFDIEEKDKIKREALRGKLKELNLYPLQKSVWVCPYNFFKEMNILRQFFGLKNSEMKIITASEIEDDKEIKIHFGLVK